LLSFLIPKKGDRLAVDAACELGEWSNDVRVVGNLSG
jgi:hypothetical protein